MFNWRSSWSAAFMPSCLSLTGWLCAAASRVRRRRTDTPSRRTPSPLEIKFGDSSRHGSLGGGRDRGGGEAARGQGFWLRGGWLRQRGARRGGERGYDRDSRGGGGGGFGDGEDTAGVMVEVTVVVTAVKVGDTAVVVVSGGGGYRDRPLS